MLPKVYTPAEVADTLQVTEEEVMHMVESGELRSFAVLGKYTRIKADALFELMDRPHEGAADNGGRSDAFPPLGRNHRLERSRKRNLAREKAARAWAQDKIRAIAPDLSIHTRQRFVANGKQGILGVSTIKSGFREEYWFGFPEELLANELPTIIVPVIADTNKRIAFVIPYENHRRAFDGLSRDRQGSKKFGIVEKSGALYLRGKGIEQQIDLSRYIDRFDMFREVLRAPFEDQHSPDVE